MKTRAKFQCSEITKTAWADKIKLLAVVGGSKENEEFFGTTPTGLLEITVKNPEVSKMFEPSKEYYIDIIPAEEKK